MLLIAAAVLCFASGSFGDEPFRTLILSGGEGDGCRASTSFLQRLLEHSGRFEVRINEAPDGLAASSLARFDLVINNGPGPNPGHESEKALREFLKAGKGLVLTRTALLGQRFSFGLLKPTGSTSARDAPFQRFELTSIQSEHPIMQGLAKSWRTADRPIQGLILETGAELLAASADAKPLLFTSQPDEGRIFGTALGYDLGSMEEPAFITTFLRGAEWAASGKVTFPSEIGMPGPDTNDVRVLLITGGHDHESSFYGLFDGYRDLGWIPVTDSKLAFQQDIRGKYDVLVFYDFTRDMDEKAKTNLRNFVESGKGIVVLHHGILNFQKWPWWYEEVVGGLYRLERQGSIPNSTVNYGERHLITPAGQHPITAGLGPFELTDETYKGLFISEKIMPLLVTDNPTSDRTVAWIGPCATSKVVFIQLGHDHLAFQHPSYRALVHNSILWTAGKLK